MSSGTLQPEEWVEIVQRIQSGDASVGAYMADRERHFDNYFQMITNDTYTPVFTYGGSGLTTTPTSIRVEGFRIGTWVQLNVIGFFGSAPTVRAAPAEFEISLPDALPVQFTVPSFGTIGTFVYYDSDAASGRTFHIGSAFPSNTRNVVYGVADAQSVFDTFTTDFPEINDICSMSIQYRTTPQIFL